LRGEVVEIVAGKTVSTVRVEVGEVVFRVLITAESSARLDLDAGDDVAIRWKATARRGSSASLRRRDASRKIAAEAFVSAQVI